MTVWRLVRGAVWSAIDRSQEPTRRIVLAGRRALFVKRLRWHAGLRHGHVDVDVARGVVLGRRVRIVLDPGTKNRLILAAGSRVEDGVTLWLRGGTVEIGPEAEIRRHVTMDSSGSLTIGADAMVGWGATLHCAESLTIGRQAVVAEYASIVDSRHLRTPPGVNLLHHVTASPTRIGDGAWIGAHAIIGAGVDIGDGAVVGAGSVVTRDVEPGWLVVGAPARPVRHLPVEHVDG